MSSTSINEPVFTRKRALSESLVMSSSSATDNDNQRSLSTASVAYLNSTQPPAASSSSASTIPNNNNNNNTNTNNSASANSKTLGGTVSFAEEIELHPDSSPGSFLSPIVAADSRRKDEDDKNQTLRFARTITLFGGDEDENERSYYDKSTKRDSVMAESNIDDQQLQQQHSKSKRLSLAADRFGSSAMFDSTAAEAFGNAVNDFGNSNNSNEASMGDDVFGSNNNNAASDLLPSSTQGWFNELNDDTSDAEEALFSNLVTQFANTMKFDASLNSAAATQSIMSVTSGSQLQAAGNNNDEEQHTPPPLRARSNTFFRKSAIQTRSILLETTKKMDEEANNASREQIEAVDFPKRLRQIFKLVVWPDLVKRHEEAKKNLIMMKSKRNNNNNNTKSIREQEDNNNFFSDDENDKETTVSLAAASWDPLNDFSKDEIRCLWLDYGRVFASEVTDGKFFGSSSDNDDENNEDNMAASLTNKNKSEEIDENETFEEHLLKKQNKRKRKDSVVATSPKSPGSTKKQQSSSSRRSSVSAKQSQQSRRNSIIATGEKETASPVKSASSPRSASALARQDEREKTVEQKKRQKIDDTIDIIKKLQKWNEVTISKKALAEFALLSGIELDGQSAAPSVTNNNNHHHSSSPSHQENHEQDDIAFSKLNASNWFSPESSSLLPNTNTTDRRPPARLLGASSYHSREDSINNNNNLVQNGSEGSISLSPSRSAFFSSGSSGSPNSQKKKFTFVDVMFWICRDADLAKHDQHAKTKVRMRANGCRPLSSKTIDSLFSVFGAFDKDGSGELDRDEIGQLFNLMTSSTSVAHVPLNRDEDNASPMSPLALAKKAKDNHNINNSSPFDSDAHNNSSFDFQTPLISPTKSNNNNNEGEPATPLSLLGRNPSDLSVLSTGGNGTLTSLQRSPDRDLNNNSDSLLPTVQISSRQHQQQQLSEYDLDLLMEVIDTDGNGTIDFQEALLLLASDLDQGLGKFFNDDDEDGVGGSGRNNNGFDDSSTTSSSTSTSDDDDDEDSFFTAGGIARNLAKKKKKMNNKSRTHLHSKKKSSHRRQQSDLTGIRDSGLDHKIMHCFRKYDPCRTGYVSMEQLRVVILDLAGEHLTLDQIEDIIDAADSLRGDGYVNYLNWECLWSCARGESSLKD